MATASSSPDTWRSGDAYERYMGRWSRLLAARFLEWFGEPPGRRWLDVGCGTGALSAAIVEYSAPQALTGIDPSEGFLATARERLGDGVELHRAPASAIPMPDGAVAAAVSGLVLNFVPDAVAALREMARVTAVGGRVGIYVWDYAGRMEMIRTYWDTAAEFDPTLQGQGERFPLCQPDALAAAFADAGLQQVGVAPLEMTIRFADFDDYWQPFLGGQGPAPAHAVSLAEPAREQLRERIRARLPVQPDGSILLGARAWAARGRVVR